MKEVDERGGRIIIIKEKKGEERERIEKMEKIVMKEVKELI